MFTFNNNQYALVLVIVLLIHVFLGLTLLPFYQYQINPDGINYIAIAQKYIRGEFPDAINGYWSPLLAWLLIPLIKIGVPPLVATKILSLLIGTFTLLGVAFFSLRFKLNPFVRIAIWFALIPIVLYYEFHVITPDLLLATLLIYYFIIISHPVYATKKYHGLITGFLGGAAYLAKSFAFPFFFLHFPLMHFLHYLRRRKNQGGRVFFLNFLIGFSVFCFVSIPWIIILSSKYDGITFSTTTERIFALSGPQGHGDLGEDFRLLPPPNRSALSAAEDPLNIPETPWHPLSSLSDFAYYLNFLWRNILKTFIVYIKFSFLSLIIVLIYFIFLVKRLRQGRIPLLSFFTLSTIFLYTGGYILIFICERYFWALNFLLLLMGGFLIVYLCQTANFEKWLQGVVLFLFLFTFTGAPIALLIRDLNINKDVYQASEFLRSDYQWQGRIASNQDWKYTFYFAYHLGCPYYGQTGNRLNIEEFQESLQAHQIDYYFHWGDDRGYSDFLSSYQELTKGGILGLEIYDLNTKKSSLHP